MHGMFPNDLFPESDDPRPAEEAASTRVFSVWGVDRPDQEPAGDLVSRGVGGWRDFQLCPAAVGTLLLDSEGRSRTASRGDVAQRSRARAVRPARRAGGDLPGAHRRLRSSRKLSTHHRADRAPGDRRPGVGLATAPRQARSGRVVRSGKEAAAAAVRAANRRGHEPHRGRDPRFPSSPRPALARRRRAGHPHASPGRGRG